MASRLRLTPSVAVHSGKPSVVKASRISWLILWQPCTNTQGRKSVVALQKLYAPFSATSGVRQGCILAPALLGIAIDWILDQMTDKPGVDVGDVTLL